ncbi:MAG: phosphohydrolase, partial [Desulfobacteraceae bacterium]|nr:phosphohydrolase [Desulfobacteraceae bacterium]
MDKFKGFSTPPILESLKSTLNQQEREIFPPAATDSESGVRRHPIVDSAAGYRQAFSLDSDRILHSRAYTRYIDKTQVF